ncbi:hypothetical protein ACFR97_13365 [Haloplanus litoreus]|uniref:Integral membrane protein n=1 Tax=Haloplanus litoreus TaxID=767515 RepID=A0ABD6A1A2_9EURY
MAGLHREVAGSAAFALLSGLVLWPPGDVYWRRLAALVGDGPTLGVVLLAAVALGVGFASVTAVGVWRFLAGGTVAYVVGMAAVEAVSTPDSPVHLVWYGGILVCLVAGVALRRRAIGVGSKTQSADA